MLNIKINKNFKVLRTKDIFLILRVNIASSFYSTVAKELITNVMT